MASGADLKINDFGGIIPVLFPTALPDGCAITAHNLYLKNKKLVPIREPALVKGVMVWNENGLPNISATKSLKLWRFGDRKEFLAWPGYVWVAQGNIADDNHSRIFVTGDTGVGGLGKNLPCVYIRSQDGNSFVRHPITKKSLPEPIVRRPYTDQPLDENNIRYTFFFQTWVDEYGYESGVSPASNNDPEDKDPSVSGARGGSLMYNDGDEVTISGVTAINDGLRAARFRRIWKVVTGTTIESIQFIAEQERVGEDGFTTLRVIVKDENAGEILPLIQSPPDDLTMMTYVNNAFYVAISRSRRRTLMCSEINMPTSFPDAYKMDVHDDIVAVAVAGNTVYALTTGYPVAFSGTTPDALVSTPIKSPQACLSPRGVCTIENAVFYISHDGIVMLSPSIGDVAQIITENYFDKNAWQALNPASGFLSVYDNAIHAWFMVPDGTKDANGEPILKPKGYIFDMRAGTAAVTTHQEAAAAAYYDAQDDALYYVRMGGSI